MKTIRVDFSKKILKEICRQGEKNTAFLDFVLPADFAGADYVNAEFKKPSGKKETVELLDPAGVFVPMTAELTSEYGWIGIQLTAYKLEGDEIIEIAKSPIVYGVIERSLGGSHHAGESVIERIIAFINEWRDKLVEMWRDKHTHANKETLDEITAQTIGDIEQNTQDRHTHANKTVLDDFSRLSGILQFDGHAIPQFLINNVEPVTQSDDYTVPWLKPNVWYRFGSADSPVRSISILELESVDNAVAEEYLIEFWTSENAPSPVIFPSDVEWPDGSEPVWASNKHYQVSIVGNVGLYSATDYEVGA